MHLLLVHGLGASKLSWRVFTSLISKNINVTYLEYEPGEKAKDVINRGIAKIDNISEKVVVIGHSLGGIIAWHIAQQSDNVLAGVSIASPFGGFSPLSFFLPLMFLPGKIPNMLSELRIGKPFTSKPQKHESKVPWLNIVTNKGLFETPENDGVLTVQNQIEIYTPHKTETVYHTHIEVLNSDLTVQNVVNFLEELK